MMVLRSFGDNSDTFADGPKACSLAGYVGNQDQWEQFEGEWDAALKLHHIPWLHMTDFNANEKPYTHLRDQDAERKAIMQSLIGVIRNCSLLGFYSVIRLEEFERFCADKCVLIDPYAFNLYVCKVMMAREWPDARIELKLDRVPKPNNKIALSDLYMDSDPLHAGGGKRISVEALAECDTFREITPIQSADFLAWESRKEAIHKDGWNAGGSDWAALPEYKKSLESWAAGNGRKYPFERKSFGALIEEGVIGKTWGYPELENIHNSRGGRWPVLEERLS